MVDIRAEEPDFTEEETASAGHKLGQWIGDWWEQHIVQPMLEEVAGQLELFLDTRFKQRECRGEKVVWPDAEGNGVDYDFVMELGGDLQKQGVPVAFVECFWRRGARHSKDKARDDSGKLSPMRYAYPTARFLGIVAAGDFSGPARELVMSRQMDLFYIPKAKIVEAFAANGLEMDYPDKSKEDFKAALADQFEKDFTAEKKTLVAATLRKRVGRAVFSGYVSRVKASLSALPLEIRFIESAHSDPVVFKSVTEASAFLENPAFGEDKNLITYRYEINYSDGSYFTREVAGMEELKTLHSQLAVLAAHAEYLAAR